MPAKWQQWMPFHIDRFKASPAVQAMHPVARIGYLYLLACSWQSEDCTIPADDDTLAELSGLGYELWAEHSTRILRKFVALDGKLRNPSCYEEWREAKRIYEARQDSAKRTNTERSLNGHRAVTERSPIRSADTITLTVTDTNTVKTKATPKAAPSSFVLPDWIDKDAWNGYEEMRKKIRAPLTDRAREGIIRELEKLSPLGSNGAEILDQSTRNSWRGVFEVKGTEKHDPLKGMIFANGRNGNGKLDKFEQMRRDDEELFGGEQEEDLSRAH